jgi:hypothetical protein
VLLELDGVILVLEPGRKRAVLLAVREGGCVAEIAEAPEDGEADVALLFIPLLEQGLRLLKAEPAVRHALREIGRAFARLVHVHPPPLVGLLPVDGGPVSGVERHAAAQDWSTKPGASLSTMRAWLIR